MPSSPGRSCPEASGQEGGICARFRFCFCVSEIFLVLIKSEELGETQLGPVRYNPHPEPSQGNRDLPAASPVPRPGAEGQTELPRAPAQPC